MRSTWRLKSCPRCSGSVRIVTQLAGSDVYCINCGWRRTITEVRMDRRRETVHRRKAERVA